jgi:hypothetical protein
MVIVGAGLTENVPRANNKLNRKTVRNQTIFGKRSSRSCRQSLRDEYHKRSRVHNASMQRVVWQQTKRGTGGTWLL